MKAYGWFEKVYEEAKDSFEFKLEGLKIEVVERILEAMERKDVNRKELADLLGVSKPFVSKLLNNGSNVTIKTLLQITEALDCDLNVSIKSRVETKEFREIEEDMFKEVPYQPHFEINTLKISPRIADGYAMDDLCMVNYA